MKRALFALSVLLNLAGLLAFGWLWASRGLTLLQPIRERTRSLYEALPVHERDVVFLGDSLTEAAAWDELFPGVPARNRGIGGDTTADVLARLDDVVRGRPAAVFLEIGTNDVSRSSPVEEIAERVSTILRRLRAESPDTTVYLQSVLPREAAWTGTVRELNAALEPLAQEHGAVWIDVFPLFLDDEGRSLRDRYTNDGLHLTGEGYLVWRDALEPYVRGVDAEPSAGGPPPGAQAPSVSSSS